MARWLRSIMVLGALWCLPAWADGRMTEARQNYVYDPGAETVTLELTTIYAGVDADRFRELYGKIGASGYSKAKLDYYRGMYGTVVEVAPAAVKDGGNTVETRERYTVSLSGGDSDLVKHRFPIYPDLLRGFFSALPPLVAQPYGLDGTLDHRDIVTVTAPTLGTYNVSDGAVSDRFFAFTRTAKAESGRVELNYRLRFLADQVPVAEFAGYSADIERMDHNIFAWIDLDRDAYHRYYRDIPHLIRGMGAAVLVIGAALGWWVRRRRRAGRK